MFLYVRMAVYVIANAIGGAAFVDLDIDAGRISFDLEGLALFITGLVVTGVTFITSRFARAR